jgi:hypothetical protein
MKKETIIELIGLALENKTENGIQQKVGGSEIKIAILQRGWVVIGRYSDDGDDGVLNDAYVIRSWGTTKGLGELALEGKQENTKLDKTGIVRFNKLTSVALIDCDDKKWDKKL